MTRSEISKLREAYIADRQDILRKYISSTKKKLLDIIIDRFIDKLVSENGVIISNNKNIELTTALDKIFAEFSKSDYQKLINRFAEDLKGITELNHRYFKTIEPDQDKLSKVQKDTDLLMRKRLGLNTKGEIVKKGFLDRLISDETLLRKVKEETFRSITQGKPIKDYRNKITKLVAGSKGVDGGLQRHFNTFATDTYNNYERTLSHQYATRLDLKYFIYAGGTIQTSREFCEIHNGKVYTTEEAQKWKKQVGKPKGPVWNEEKDGAYNRLSDLGGYNCRHSIDYISESLAKRLR